MCSGALEEYDERNYFIEFKSLELVAYNNWNFLELLIYSWIGPLLTELEQFVARHYIVEKLENHR